jgi:site-specific DNA-methyltransferase (adenine-specific)
MIEYFNEDCMVGMARYPDKHFDLAIVDPPYGIDINSSGRLGHYGGKGKTWDSCIPNEEYFKELQRVSKNQIVWGGNYFQLPPTRCFLIWDKQQPEGVSFASCEFAWTSYNLSAKTFYKRPQGQDGGNRIHPTQKPVALYKWLLTNYAKPGDLILDTHVGSASSLIACHQLGFDAVGFELDEDYYRESKQRLERFMKQITLFDILELEK